MVGPALAHLSLGMPPALALTWYLTVIAGPIILPGYLVASAAILIAAIGSVLAFFRDKLRPIAPTDDTARIDARLHAVEGTVLRLHGALAIRGIVPQPGPQPHDRAQAGQA